MTPLRRLTISTACKHRTGGHTRTIKRRIAFASTTAPQTRSFKKYRLYLKRINSVAAQQASMVAALGVKDSTYLRMGSLDGFGEFCGISPAGLTLRGITSSGLIQPTGQNLSSSINTIGKFQLALLPSNQSASLFQGIPMSLELKV